MRRLSKRFGGWATGSRRDEFAWARTKLTVFYLAIIVIIVLILSSAVFSLNAYRVLRIAHERLERGETVPDLRSMEIEAGDYFTDLRRVIITGDLITIAAAGALSYLLAGRTLRPIKRTHESQRRFIANAAHDLRTPLAIIRAEADVALRQGQMGADELRDLLSTQIEEIDRMAAMVDQMLALIRQREESPGQAASAVALCEVAGFVRDRMRGIAAKKTLSLDVECGETGLVRGDRDSLTRAVSNVVENAIAYTPQGGAVRIEVSRSGGHVELRVSDTGIGISESDLPHIAESFYRADAARQVNTGGSGLGLAIVREIVTTHRGSLRIESASPSGTVVTLRFPAA